MKKFKITPVSLIFLFIFTPCLLFGGDKFIKFIFEYPLNISEFINSNNIYFLKDINDEKGVGVFLIDNKIKYLKIPQRYLHFINNDTLNILVECHASFDTDSLPKSFIRVPKVFNCDSNQIFPDTVGFFYLCSKKVIASFKNDTSTVLIKWKMNDCEIRPLWYGDY